MAIAEVLVHPGRSQIRRPAAGCSEGAQRLSGSWNQVMGGVLFWPGTVMRHQIGRPAVGQQEVGWGYRGMVVAIGDIPVYPETCVGNQIRKPQSGGGEEGHMIRSCLNQVVAIEEAPVCQRIVVSSQIRRTPVEVAEVAQMQSCGLMFVHHDIGVLLLIFRCCLVEVEDWMLVGTQ